jgi:hypothetical protein
MSTRMRASFDSTVAEIVDLAMRAQRRSPTYRKLHWATAAAVAVVVGIAVFRASSTSVPLAVALSAVAAAIGIVVYHVATVAVNRWYAKQSIRRHLGGAQSLHSDVELQDSGVLFQEMSMDLLIKWPQIDRAIITDAGIEIWHEESLLGLVRSRGFATEAEQHEFAREINRRASEVAAS